MAIMVDELIDYGKRIGKAGPEWCHLTTDGDLEELHTFARTIGLSRHWCSDHTQPRAKPIHYDLTKGKRALALKCGAVFVPALEQARQRERIRRESEAQ